MDLRRAGAGQVGFGALVPDAPRLDCPGEGGSGTPIVAAHPRRDAGVIEPRGPRLVVLAGPPCRHLAAPTNAANVKKSPCQLGAVQDLDRFMSTRLCEVLRLS